MQISNNNNQPNFTSIYRMKHANMAIYKTLLNDVLPGAMFVKNKAYSTFLGSNPQEIYSVGFIDYLRDKKYSYSWFRQNSAQHGVKIPNLEDSDIWVFSGKDAEIPVMYKNEIMEQERPEGFIKKIIAHFKGYREFVKHKDELSEVPMHLRGIKYETIMNEKHTDSFHKLLEGKEISEVKSIEELAKKIIMAQD